MNPQEMNLKKLTLNEYTLSNKSVIKHLCSKFTKSTNFIGAVKIGRWFLRTINGGHSC